MVKVWFRAFGLLTLLFAVGILALTPATTECHPDPPPPLAHLRPAAFAAVALAVGFGLLHLRKWAAAAFAVVSTWLGAWLLASPLRDVPYPWALINLAIGVALLFPAAVVVRHWSRLSWGRRGLKRSAAA